MRSDEIKHCWFNANRICDSGCAAYSPTRPNCIFLLIIRNLMGTVTISANNTGQTFPPGAIPPEVTT